ncbi:hypothetical protein ACWGB8_21625 [Kitasatospora sp. NPDC054939]
MRKVLGSAVVVGVVAVVLTATGAARAGKVASAVREVNQGYSIPVGAVTDLGALPVLAGLGYDLVGLLGH